MTLPSTEPHTNHPQALPLSIRLAYRRAKKAWEVRIGFMMLAKFENVEGGVGVVFCYCPECLTKRGDPLRHDFHTNHPMKWAKEVGRLYPSIRDTLLEWASRR